MGNSKYLDSLGASKIINKIKENEKKAETDLSQHNSSETAHSFILGEIGGLEDRLLALEIASGGGGAEVTANPFAVTFGSLDGTISDGVWDKSRKSLGF